MGARKIKFKLKRDRKPAKVDVLTTTSEKSGFAWFLETFLRRFRTMSFLVFMAPVVVLCCFCLGTAAGGGMYVFETFREHSVSVTSPVGRYMILGFGVACGYLSYGICLLFVVPWVNFLMPFRVREFRGPWFSLATVPWYVHNALTYMVRFTFLEFVTPSPLNIMFYRMMGMKIGKGVVINTANISDPCLITIEDYVTVGGSATIFAHYGQKGFLIIAPVHIGKGTNVGLKASIMGGVRVGENVTIRPHTALLPKTEVPDGETV